MTEDAGIGILDFRALLEAAPDGIAVVDEQGRMLVVNDRFCELFGYERSEVIGNLIRMLIPERLREVHAEHRRHYFEHPTKRPMGLGLQLVGVRKDGSEIPVEISLSPMSSEGHALAVAAIRDISEQKRLREQDAALRSIIDTEEERYRIGMDLHDGIMQDIYAVTLGLDLALEDIDAEPGQAKDGVERSIGQLHDVIRDIRSYIFDLRPRQFAGDLPKALWDLAREFEENSSIKTSVILPSEFPVIDQAAGVAFYVITHEALSNARKYAQANLITIALSVDDRDLVLEVRDDGKGFDRSRRVSEGHRGLRNMASRASVIGAHLEIDSAIGQGTSIRVTYRLRDE